MSFWKRDGEEEGCGCNLYADLCGDISDWLGEYGVDMCDETTQKILTGIFADPDIMTLSADGEEEGWHN